MQIVFGIVCAIIGLILWRWMNVTRERWKNSERLQKQLAIKKNKKRLEREAHKGRQYKRAYVGITILWIGCILISSINSFGGMTVEGMEVATKIIADVVESKDFARDPVLYEISSGIDEITRYEMQKEKGLFWDIGESSSTKAVSPETIKGYREQLNQKVGSLQAVMDASLIIDDGVVADYARLKELDGIIRNYEDRTKVPIEVYIEEFEIRRHACSEKYSEENVYQTARAADDIFHILFLKYKQGNSVSLKMKELDELFYYASSANIYYNESLKWNNCEESRNDILFKMGLIFQKLYLLADVLDGESTQTLQEDGKRKIHFLLMANAFFEMCHYYDREDNLCSELYDYYCGCNFYEIGYSADLQYTEVFWRESIKYLQNYIDKQYTLSEEERDDKLIFDSEYRMKIIKPQISEAFH